MASKYGCRCVVLGWLACAATFAACQRAEPKPEPPLAVVVKTPAERGKALVTTGLCNDCHTPKKLGPNGPEPDMARALSGHPEDLAVTTPFRPTRGRPWAAATNDQLTAWSGPWGVSFTANLTPDTLTGLRSGVWTEQRFIKALRTGRHMGTSRPILPPMPWQFIREYSDEDLKAIWAFLGTIPAIRNHVPDPLDPSGEPIHEPDPVEGELVQEPVSPSPTPAPAAQPE